MREGEEQEILKGYEGICRGMRQDMDKRSVFKMGWVAVLLALLTAGPSWLWAVSSGPELPNPGSPMINRQQQEQMGQQAMASVTATQSAVKSA